MNKFSAIVAFMLMIGIVASVAFAMSSLLFGSVWTIPDKPIAGEATTVYATFTNDGDTGTTYNLTGYGWGPSGGFVSFFDNPDLKNFSRIGRIGFINPKENKTEIDNIVFPEAGTWELHFLLRDMNTGEFKTRTLIVEVQEKPSPIPIIGLPPIRIIPPWIPMPPIKAQTAY